jgi:uncharacterized protein (TIGR03437 family)
VQPGHHRPRITASVRHSHPPVVFYAGAAPGTVAGVVQINFQIPAPYIHSPAAYTFTLSASGKSSAPAAIYVTP